MLRNFRGTGAIFRLSLIAVSLTLVACAHTPAPPRNLSPEAALAEVRRAEPPEPDAESVPAPIAENWEKYSGRKKYVRNGECVALVQDAIPRLGNTRTWVRGEQVYGNSALEPGTAIATFNENGLYDNKGRGTSHAALYVSQDETGLYVVDQWRATRKSRGQKPKERFIPWTGENSETLPSNTGEAYYVINMRDEDAPELEVPAMVDAPEIAAEDEENP